MTHDKVNRIASALKSLSVSIDSMLLPDEYSTLGRDVNDASDILRAAFRKSVTAKLAQKQKESKPQASVTAFLNT